MLVDLQRQVESETDDFFRWTPVDSMHLTLYFLGDCDEATLNEIIHRVDQISLSPFEVTMEGIIILPEPTIPRILAVSLGDPAGTLRRLQQQVQDRVSPIAPYRETRLFRPHITFGRLRKDKPSNAKQVKRALSKLSVPKGISFVATSFDLMESNLTETGTTYDTIRDFKLLA